MSGTLTTLANLKAWLSIVTTTDDALLTRLITAQSSRIQNWLNREIANQQYAIQLDGQGNDQIIFPNYPCTGVSSLTINDIPIPASPDGGILQDGYGFDWDRLRVVGYQFSRGQYYANDFTRGRGNIALTYNAGFLVGAANPDPNKQLYPAEAWTIPATPYQIPVTSLAHIWSADVGITKAGVAMVAVSGVPTTGQYSVAQVAGVWTYTFAAADTGAAILISYSHVPPDLEQACIDLCAWVYKQRNRIGFKTENLAGQSVSYDVGAMPAWVTDSLNQYRKVWV